MPYILGMQAEQVPPKTSGDFCQLKVSWLFGDLPFDYVQIDWIPAAERGGLAIHAADVPVENRQPDSYIISVRTGLNIFVGVQPMKLEGGLPATHLPNDEGTMQWWTDFRLELDLHTEREPVRQAGNGDCRTPPTIVRSDFEWGKVRVWWDNPENYNLFDVDWEQVAGGSRGGGRQAEEPEHLIDKVRAGERYRVRVKGWHDRTLGNDCSSDWSPWYEVLIPDQYGYRDPTFDDSIAIAATSRDEGLVDVFAVDSAGAVVTSWNEPTGWGMWFPIGARRFPKHTKPAALSRDTDFMDIFAIADDGCAYVAWWNGPPWREWTKLGDSLFNAGTSIAAVSRDADHMDLFAVGKDGQLWQASWNGPPWTPWAPVVGAAFTPSAPVAALARDDDNLEVWAVGQDGVVRGNYWNGAWHDWYALAGRTFPQGTPLAAISRHRDHMELFGVGDDHQVHHTWWLEGWQGWSTLAGATFDHHAPIAAEVLHSDDMHVFIVGQDRDVRGIKFDERWGDWFVMTTGPRHGMGPAFLPPVASATVTAHNLSLFTCSASPGSPFVWMAWWSRGPQPWQRVA